MENHHQATDAMTANRTVNMIAVYTTVGSKNDAQRLATALIDRQLAACAQITEIDSHYFWAGTTQHEPEWRILFKTTQDRYPAIESAIRALHPYELPAIYALDVAYADADYAAWVRQGSSDAGTPGREGEI